MVRALAYYLPQYHRIPENDEWWGDGFTEWVNVRRAQPRWSNHDQPRVPTELGYYDLDDPDVMPAQMKLAREHGIEGFCYYKYWFGNGRELLEKPLKRMLADPRCDMPFCLFWANENWTRTWAGHKRGLLMEQCYPDDDTTTHAADLASYFRDPRYIRVGNAPVLVIWRPKSFQTEGGYLDKLRSELAKLGFPELHLLMVGVRNMGKYFNRYPYTLGTMLDFSSTLAKERAEAQTEQGWVEYADLAKAVVSRYADHKIYRTVLTGFDCTPRRQNASQVVMGATPELYANWLDQTCALAVRDFRPEEQFVFIFAWNEWGEGAYLEPDKTFGRGFLEATRDVMAKWKTVV